MAEFAEVMKQIQRFCGSQINCESCPVWNREDMCCKVEHAFHDGELSDALPEIERIVMDWAAKHPEPRYPTWEEWHKEKFPNARHNICPIYFLSEKPLGSCSVSCEECARTPIPADIAEKLGVKPMGGENDV